jgi:hypothetical protein
MGTTDINLGIHLYVDGTACDAIHLYTSKPGTYFCPEETRMDQQKFTTEQAAAAIVSLINSRPQSPSQAEIADIIACVAGVVHDPKAEAIKLCRRAQRAVQAELDTEGTSAHTLACREADRCEFEIEDLRSRLAAKSPKTLDDIAALAVLALYWEGYLLEELARKCEEDRIAIGDRALPTLFLVVVEFFGIDQNEFAS